MGEAARKLTIPSYRLHVPSGLAVVTLRDPATGKYKDHYLGKYNSPESRQKYERLVGDWLIRGRGGLPLRTKEGLTVKQLFDAFLAHAEGPESPYKKCGRLTSTPRAMRHIAQWVVQLFGERPAEEVTAGDLRRLIEWLMKDVPRRDGGKGWDHTTAARALVLCKQVYRWATEHELLDGRAWGALSAVRMPRRPGAAKARSKVRPVPLAVFEATLPHCHALLADMLRVQYLAAMRPCEVRGMTPGDIDRGGRLPDGTTFPGVWCYAVAEEFNKNAHRGQERFVFLGPKAQAVITPFLEGRPADRPVFSAAEAPNSKAEPGAYYCTSSYDAALHSAIRRAQASRDEALARGETVGPEVPHWSPNQLRHLRATELRHLYNREAARTVLGHTTPGVTETYAEVDYALAARVMRETG